jgi:hypothetical protein
VYDKKSNFYLKEASNLWAPCQNTDRESQLSQVPNLLDLKQEIIKAGQHKTIPIVCTKRRDKTSSFLTCQIVSCKYKNHEVQMV